MLSKQKLTQNLMLTDELNKLRNENKEVVKQNSSIRPNHFSSFSWSVGPKSQNIFDFKKFFKFTINPSNLSNANNNKTSKASLKKYFTNFTLKNYKPINNFTTINSMLNSFINVTKIPQNNNPTNKMPIKSIINEKNFQFKQNKFESVIAFNYSTTRVYKVNRNDTITPIVSIAKINTTLITFTSTLAKNQTSQHEQIIWQKNNVDLLNLKNFIAEYDYMNCTERNQRISEKLAPTPLCDCPIDQLKDIYGICRTSNLATIQARLVRLCGTRLHFDLLPSRTHAAIIFSKVSI